MLPPSLDPCFSCSSSKLQKHYITLPRLPPSSCFIDQTAAAMALQHLRLGIDILRLEPLGAGSFGQVFKARVSATQQEFAVKEISADSISSELEIMQLLSCRATSSTPIVRLHAFYEQGAFYYLFMDLCRGGTLSEFMCKKRGGRLSEAEAAQVLKQLVTALRFCHDALIVHRDIKPDNVLILNESDLSSVRLADFGLSAELLYPSETLSRSVGTLPYMAPELVLGEYGSQADIWSLGVLLFQTLSGRVPFSPDNDDVREGVKMILDADLDLHSPPWDTISCSAKDLIQGMLCRNPKQRLSLEQILEHPWVLINTSTPEVLSQYQFLDAGLKQPIIRPPSQSPPGFKVEPLDLKPVIHPSTSPFPPGFEDVDRLHRPSTSPFPPGFDSVYRLHRPAPVGAAC